MRSLHPWPLFPSNLEPPAARSLSLQFAMQEFVACFKIVAQIREQVPKLIRGEEPLKEIGFLSKELEKFLLFSLDNPFAQKGGSLDKLCFYCDMLLQASRVNGQEAVGMQLEYLRNEMLATRAKIFTWKRKYPPSSIVLTEIDRLCDALVEGLRDFFEALFPYFEEARSDENILFYLIEQRRVLNKLLECPKVEQLLSRLYPSGPAHLRAILCEGYTRRGFSDFYAKHESLIDSIEWTVGPCASSTMH
ncbi:MAG: hypothetical protein KGJ02_01545 [Verrucomicrobiota bacterium]|nr:hypothetical protein [Verrucomicrobiota bacterium]